MGDRRHAIEFHNAAVAAMNDRSRPENLQSAYRLFSSAVLVDPTYGLGWYWLGNVNSDLNMQPAAIACWRRSLACDLTQSERAKALSNMGWRLIGLGQVVDAACCLLDSTDLDSDFPNPWLNLGLVHGLQGNPHLKVECTKLAYELAQKDHPDIELAPDDPGTWRTEIDPMFEMAMAFALLYDGRYAEGFRHYEIRYRYKLHQFLHYPYPKWLGEPDRTVLLVADQGLGDTLSFARFVPAAARRARFMHMAVQSELLRAFSQAFSSIPNINIVPLSNPFLPVDNWSTFVGLPFALGLTDDEIRDTPQIELPVYSKPTTWMVPDAKLHIGIAYAGSPLNDIDQHRCIPVTQFLDLYRVPGVQLYSLQVGPRAHECQDAGCMGLIRDLSPYIQDVTDTVALLRDLDLVICCESALGHICSAVGKECWIPYSLLGNDWRLGHRGEQMLWTPKHKVFQQGPDMTWGPVFERIVDELRQRVS